MIKGTTDIYCIFGSPVSHSKSPMMHNAAFNELNMDACYVAFEVRPESLRAAIEAVRALNIKGLNITVPHKEAVIPLLDWLSPEAEAIGSVNTIKNEDGLLKGYNTDAIGFVESLRERGLSVKDKKVLILGAGGAARAVIYSLLSEGARLYIYNRTFDKALSLAKTFVRFGLIEVFEDLSTVYGGKLHTIDMIVNTTSLGLGEGDPMPIDTSMVEGHHVVCDLIYKITPLLKLAAEKGCKTIDGSGMLLWQGVHAFEIWTGIRPPVETMRAVLQGRYAI